MKSKKPTKSDLDFENKIAGAVSSFDKITLPQKKRDELLQIPRKAALPPKRRAEFNYRRALAYSMMFFIFVSLTAVFSIMGIKPGTNHSPSYGCGGEANGNKNSLPQKDPQLSGGNDQSCREEENEFSEGFPCEDAPGEGIQNSLVLFCREENIFDASARPEDFPLSIYPCGRIAAALSNSFEPITNAEVLGLDINGIVVSRVRTDNNGNAYLFPSLFENDCDTEIVIIGVSGQYILPAGGNTEIKINALSQNPRKAEVLFLSDCTKNAAPIIDAIKTNIMGILEKTTQGSEKDVAFNSMFFAGKDESIYFSSFTDNIASAAYNFYPHPEIGGVLDPAVENALWNGVYFGGWDDDTIKVCVLFLGSTPDINQIDDGILSNALQKALEMGLRVIVVAPKTDDANALFLYNSIAYVTGGSFLNYSYGNLVASESAEESADGCKNILADELLKFIS